MTNNAKDKLNLFNEKCFLMSKISKDMKFPHIVISFKAINLKNNDINFKNQKFCTSFDNYIDNFPIFFVYLNYYFFIFILMNNADT